jgi:hypothetical protein
MKLLLDIPNRHAPYLLDVLQHISYVKLQTITDEKALLLSEIKEAVEEVKLVRAGVKHARNFDEFLEELDV